MVVINPVMSINVIIETLQALYLAAKPFYILPPSAFLHVEEFAILFMGKGISVWYFSLLVNLRWNGIFGMVK
jgi:hypothetical protein